MTFDWTINVSQLLALASMVFGLFSAFYAIRSDIRAIGDRVADLELDVRGQIPQNAKIAAEIGAVREDVAVLRDRAQPPPIGPHAYPPTKGS